LGVHFALADEDVAALRTIKRERTGVLVRDGAQ
jgi:hypothetical protein